MKCRNTIDRGLRWLAANQFPDGHWESVSGQGCWSVPVTAVSGMAFLMEGSTVRDGKYSDAIRRTRDWLLARQHANGLIGVPSAEQEREGFSYMHGHGFAILFLSCLVGEEENTDRRSQLVAVLEKACKFSRTAQTKRGGWGYSAREDKSGHMGGIDFDEGSVTATQVQALRAARNAGIVVPPDAIQQAIQYLGKVTNEKGGVGYSLSQNSYRQGSPALTAAAIACGFSAGEYGSPLVKNWFRFCQEAIPLYAEHRIQHDEYTHYYYAQALYILGENRWLQMFPETKPHQELTWSKYRAARFDAICKRQDRDGSWPGGVMGGIGPVFTTAVYLAMLQLDKAVLPIYQR